MKNKSSATLLIHCPDQPGLVASVTEFISENAGNILELDQHVDRENNIFFMRVEWELKNFRIAPEKIGEFFSILIAEKYSMSWKLYFSDEPVRMALFVSKSSHCLYDLLARLKSGEWNVEVPLIIGNHQSLETVAKDFSIPFYCFPITKENKQDQESKEIELLKAHDVELIVLARYMQILSPLLVETFASRIINIHHSFLPAFPGAKPYHSAYERGVKVIGATSHFVDTGLDSGPIIEQDVAKISHRDSIQDLIRKGKDLEKIVLSRAVWLYLQRKVLPYKNRTVIFD